MIKINLPQYEITFNDCKIEKKQYVLVAGGRAPDKKWLQTSTKNKVIICADKGVTYCKEAGIVPDFLLGDGDSALDDFIWAQENAVHIERFNVDKDETDLQLALSFIRGLGDNEELLVTGIWGGRFDHAYSAVFSLLQYCKQTGVKTILADTCETMLLFHEKTKVTVDFLQNPAVISVLPFCEQVNVSLQGCEWELKEQMLTLAHPYAISNRLTKANKQISFTLNEGLAGLYISYADL